MCTVSSSSNISLCVPNGSLFRSLFFLPGLWSNYVHYIGNRVALWRSPCVKVASPLIPHCWVSPGRNYFSSNRNPTIDSKKRGVQIGQRNHLSPLDITRLNKLYQCGKGMRVHTHTQTGKISELGCLCKCSHYRTVF